MINLYPPKPKAPSTWYRGSRREPVTVIGWEWDAMWRQWNAWLEFRDGTITLAWIRD
jgi:hypothetical protein